MRHSELCKNIPLLLSSVILFGIILEVVLSLFWPHIVTEPLCQYDPVLGWTNIPEAKVKQRFGDNHYYYRTHNRKGLRSLREIPYDKQAGSKRILLIGDSFMWGYGVDDKDVISEVMQKRFGARVEIVNGAVSGYGTDQVLLWLTREGLRYHPDLVIFGYYPGNDIEEIATSNNHGYLKPVFLLEGGMLVLQNVPVPDTAETRRKRFGSPDSFFGSVKKYLRHHLHSYQFIVGRLNSIPAMRKAILAAGIGEDYSWMYKDVPVFILADQEKIMDLSDALLAEIQRVSKEAGADFLLLFIPKKEQQLEKNGSNAMQQDAKNYAWNNGADDYLTGFTRKKGIHLLDLLPLMRSAQEHGAILNHSGMDDHHWTPEGQRFAADAIAEQLERTGLLRP